MRYLLIAFGLMSVSALEAATKSDSSKSWEVQNYLQSLQNEIQKQQTTVDNLAASIERTDVITSSAINSEFENAYTMLNVKKTLYANFIGTPSLESPLVRAKLLQIFQKDLITPNDLSELQTLVQQERPKYVTPSTPTPAPATSTAPN